MHCIDREQMELRNKRHAYESCAATNSSNSSPSSCYAIAIMPEAPHLKLL